MGSLVTWLILGRRRAEWRTQAAAQATMRAISSWLKLVCSFESTKELKFPSSSTLLSKGLA